LKSLVIPASVGNIIGNPFSGWNGELKCLSPYFIYDNKVLFDKDKSKIIAFRDRNTTSYVIPDSVSCIEFGAFWNCHSLKRLVLPDSVSSIGDWAFWNCRSLTDIVIPDSVNSIGDRVFSGCCSLKSLVLPDSVSSIGESAFEDCTSLSSLVIPEGVTSIGDGAFWGCSFPYDLKKELISRFGDKIFGNHDGL
jgi:hypothetical protein